MHPQDEVHLREAIELGRAGLRRGDGGPFGAVIAQNGEVIGRGWNRVTSTHDPTAHAEIVAIREACARQARFHLENAVLYASCEPCPMCLAAVYWAGIVRVVYAATRADAARAGFADAELYEEAARAPDRRRIPFEHVPLDAARALFVEWQAKPDRIPY